MKIKKLLLPLSAFAFVGATFVAMQSLVSCDKQNIYRIFEISDQRLIGFKTSMTQEEINGALGRYNTLPIPSQITEIAPDAFASTKNVTIPANIKTLDLSQTIVTNIGENAFFGALFENIIFGEKQDTIGKNAFSQLVNLKKIDLSNLDDLSSISKNKTAFDKKHPLAGAVVLKAGATKEDIDKIIDYLGPSFFLHENKGWKIQDTAGWPPKAEIFDNLIPLFNIGSTGKTNGFHPYFNIINDNEKLDILRKYLYDFDTLPILSEICEIEDYAFYKSGYGKDGDLGCCTIPNWITKLRFEPESNCTKIGMRAFFQCLTLKDVRIPKSVNQLGDEAFCGCANLNCINVVDFKSTPTSWSIVNPFKGIQTGGAIHFNSLGASQTAWKEFFVSISSNLSSWVCQEWDRTSENLFKITTYDDIDDKNNEKEVILDGFNKHLTANEIEYMLSLDGNVELVIPKEVTTISDRTFWSTRGEEEEEYYSTIPSHIKTLRFEEGSECSVIWDYAFMCAPFEKVVIPPKMIAFGGLDSGGLFSRCPNLKEIDLSALKTIPMAVIAWDLYNFYDIPKGGIVYINPRTSVDGWNKLFKDTHSDCNHDNGWTITPIEVTDH